ncbi:MAG: hypothetical protein RLZZ52_1130 [Actinomycetota bacterium]
MTRIKARFFSPLIGVLMSFCVGGALFFSASAAHAVGTLDQQFTGSVNTYTYIENGSPKGQTFTAGITGALDAFTIQLRKQGSPGVLNGAIYAESNGLPAGNPLATTTVAESAVSSSAIVTVSFDFTTPVSVAAGTTYVFVVTAPNATTTYPSTPPFTPTYDNYIMYFGNPGAEPAGTHSLYMGSGSPWLIFNQSFLFATYVTPPAQPSSSATPSTSSSPSNSTATVPATVEASLASTGNKSHSGEEIVLLGAVLLIAGGITWNISRAHTRRKISR